GQDPSRLLLATFTMQPNGLVSGKCPCYTSRGQGMLCEHIMAVALATARYYGSEERRRQYAAERAQAQRLAKCKDLIQRAPHATPLTVRVFIKDDLKTAFVAGAVTIQIALVSQGTIYLPERLPKDRLYMVSEGDENLLCALEEIAAGPFTAEMKLSRADALSICYCSQKSWIGTRQKQAFTFSPSPIETPYQMEVSPETDTLKISILFPEEGFLLVEGNQGLWCDGKTFSPIKRLLPEPLRLLYDEPVVLPRSQLGVFFETELPLIEKVLPASPTSITRDLFTTTPGIPRFCVDLDGNEMVVTGRLRAVYGNRWVTVGVPQEISEPDPEDFYHTFGRDLEAEAEALKRVHEMGFSGRTGERLGDLRGRYVILNFLGQHLTEMRRWGWQVNLYGALNEWMEEAEVLTPVVRVHASSPTAAFEVSTVYESTRQRVEVSTIEVEEAIRHHRAFIDRPSGPPILLDIGAIKALRETLTSCHAKGGGGDGTVRIDAVHAPFVQAALEQLEGIDFEDHPDWHARALAQNRKSSPLPVPLGPLESVLRPYQKEGVYWLRFLESMGFCGILADEMGLGKTLQTLTWLQLTRCRETAQRVPALIICPTSLVENWNREAEKFVPWMKRLVLSGPDRAKEFARVPNVDLVITSYALIRRDVEFHARAAYSVVVLDEAQAIKNQRTQNALAVKQISADTRLVLSGTPIENGVSDLWSIMDFLMPRYLGPYDDFKVRYEDRIELGGADAIAAQHQLRTKLHPFLLRRVKKDVAKDLPDKIRMVSYCTLSTDQRKLYEEVRAQVREKMRGLVQEKGFDKAKFEVLALLMRLRQICCDLRLVKDRQPKPNEESSAKLEALMECIEEAKAGGHRLLVFSQFTSMLKLIAGRLQGEGIQFCYLDGETKNRVEICAQFNQTPSITVFLISLKAGGTGLNLTGADMVVHFDPWWNPAAEEQATDRAHRIGQKKTVQAIKLIAQDTIEEKVLAMQTKKQALIDATVNASDASIVSSLTMAEIESLLS
ncbi:MAG: SNF2-related protein, partial [bacterium]|nr:SNF2-related protein [bacterium]